MTVYCAFCYLDWDNKKLEAQEILTSDKVDQAFIVGFSDEARQKAYCQRHEKRLLGRIQERIPRGV